MEYEKDGYIWNPDDRLEDLIQPERMKKIKEDHLKRLEQAHNRKSDKLLDILDDDDEGCAACFI